MDKKSILDKYYYDVSSGFISATKLYQKVRKFGLKLEDVKNYIDNQNIHERTAKTKKTVGRTLPSYSEIIHIDLIDMTDYKKYNNGNCWIMNCINSFSRVAYSFPLKTKSDKDTAEALQKLLDETSYISCVMTDDGSEFKGNFKKLLDENDIKHLTTLPYSPQSNGLVERFNKTMKTILFKYFKANDTYKWVDIIDKVIKNYNGTHHRIIGIEPNKVNEYNKHKVYTNIIKTMVDTKITNTKKLKVGDKVRIWKSKKLFEKAYRTEWSDEIYEIVEVKNGIRNLQYDKYVVKDKDDHIVKKKKFLLSELKLVRGNEKSANQDENKKFDKKMRTARKVAQEMGTNKHDEEEKIDERLKEPRAKRKGANKYYGDMIIFEKSYGKK